MAITTEIDKKSDILYSNTKNKLYMILAVIMGVGSALLIYKSFGIRYHTNDDAIIANILAGAYGDDRVHTVYVNIIFSALLQPLYKLYFANWYVIVQVVFMIISICVTLYILMKRLDLVGFLLGLSLITAFSEHIIYSFQYTKISFVLITAGLLIIADNLGKLNIKTGFGIFLVLTGTMIRWSSFYAVGGMSAAILLFEFFKLDYDGKKKAVITMAVMFILTFGAKAIDVIAYKSDPDWNYYTQYNDARTQFSDFATLTFDRNNNIFSSEGVSDTDFKMFVTWDFYDSEKFTPEYLNYLSSKVEGRSIKTTIVATIQNLYRMITSTNYNRMLLVIIILCALHLKISPNIMPLLGTGAVFGIFIVYLSYKVRFPSWVEISIIWTFIIFTAYCFGYTKKNKFVNLFAALLSFIYIFNVSQYRYEALVYGVDNYRQQIYIEQEYYTEMSSQKENIYLLSTISTDNTALMDPLNPRTDNFYSNIVTFGGWISSAPHRKQALSDYGLVRPIVDGVDKPNVYYDYHNIENVRRYAQQEIGVPVYAISDGDIAYAPYRLTTVAPQQK